MTTPDGARSGDASTLTLALLAQEAEARSLPLESMLAEVGVVPAHLMNPMGRVRRAAVLAFAERAVAISGDALFHVAAADKAMLGAFGALDYLMTLAATIGEGVGRIAPAYSLMNAGVKLTVRPKNGGGLCDVEPLFEPEAHWCDVETLVVIAHTRTRVATRDAHGLEAVTFALPDRGVRARMEAVLRCPVSYDAPRTTLRWSPEAWASRSRIAHPSAVQLFALPTPTAASLGDRVSELITNGLSAGAADARSIAKRLDMSERTLHRRLATEGTSYRALIAQVRERLARQYERSGTLSSSETAVLLGYSSASAFRRAARKWESDG